MAKMLTKTKIVAALAEKCDIPKKTSAAFLEALAEPGPQGGQERLHDPGGREARRAQLQGADGTEPPDRRADQDPGPAPAQVRGGQGRQGRRPLGRKRQTRGREERHSSRLRLFRSGLRPCEPSVRRASSWSAATSRASRRTRSSTPPTPSLLGGGGVDGAIHRGGGPRYSRSAAASVRPAGRCPPGEAVITGAGRLSCQHVIHTVGPIWEGGQGGRAEDLARCYRSSLALAVARRPPVGRLPQHLHGRLRISRGGGGEGRDRRGARRAPPRLSPPSS